MRLDMNTNARGRPLPRFLAKIVINKLIFTASPLYKGWHGFLPPKKAYEKLYFHPAPRSYQPMRFSVILVNLS